MFLVDNSPALAAAAKGCSKAWDLDRSAQVVQVLAASMGARVWFEYIESDANWADGISRNGVFDTWASEHGFPASVVELPTWPWTVDLCELVTGLC